jgi:hypothetical protein
VFIALTLSAALAACDSRTPQPATAAADAASSTSPASTPTAGPAGYGAITIGMTPPEANTAMALDLRAANPGEETEPCYYVMPGGDFEADPAFMVSEGRIARVDVDKPGIATAEGAQVGDSEARIMELYRGAEVTPHKYGDEGDHYVTVLDADRGRALVFETWDGSVKMIRAGKLPEAEWIEGCS